MAGTVEIGVLSLPEIPRIAGPARPVCPRNRDIQAPEKDRPQVDIPGLIWYIRAFDEKGVAFSRSFVVS
jgi:hypothetical protein